MSEGRILQLRANRVLKELHESSSVVRVLSGGSSSGKTWSIFQHLVLYCSEHLNQGKSITVARQKMTWLKGSIFPDFLKVLRALDIYEDACFNKSEMTYDLFGNQVAFLGLDDPQRLHGRRQDVAYISEAVEVSKADFDQLEMRTREHMILDFNPTADTEHWIYTSVLPREDCQKWVLTFRDNGYLDQKTIDKLLSYDPSNPVNVRNGTADKYNWLVYSQGIAMRREGAVYDNYTFVPLSDFPEDSDWSVGLDFGFRDVTAAVRVAYYGGLVYLDEVVYESDLTNPVLAGYLNAACPGRRVISDNADPKSIKELRDLGVDAVACTKGPDSIRAGIALLRRQPMKVTERSAGLRRELQNYVWGKDTQGRLTNKPVDDWNHACDAMRYCAIEKFGKKPSQVEFGFIRY